MRASNHIALAQNLSDGLYLGKKNGRNEMKASIVYIQIVICQAKKRQGTINFHIKTWF